MRRKEVSFIFLALLSVLALLPGKDGASAASLRHLNARPVSDEESVTVAGSIQEIRPGFVVINGLRFQVSENIKIIGRDGMALKDGIHGLKAGEEVEAVVEGKVILNIRVVELFK